MRPAVVVSVLSRDVQRGPAYRPATDSDGRFLEPERREQAGGVEPLGEGDGRPLKLGGEVTRVHRVDGLRERIRSRDGRVRSVASIALVREREYVPLHDAKRSVAGLVRGRADPVPDLDVDRHHLAAAVGERARDPGTVADADFDQAAVAGERLDERTTGR